MANYKGQILFPSKGKMDSDSDVRSIAQGDIIDAMNCRWGLKNDGTVNAVENILGNYPLSLNMPPGNNKCIGTCVDFPSNSVIKFVYNDQNLHSIVNINMVTKEETPILWQEEVLKFSDGYIMNAHVLNGILIYLNTNGELQNIIIESAVKYTNDKYGDGIGWWILEDDFVSQP